jgi:hypothetical protein
LSADPTDSERDDQLVQGDEARTQLDTVHDVLAELAAAPAPVQPAFDASSTEFGRFVERMRALLTEATASRHEAAVAEQCAWCGSPVQLAFGTTILGGERRHSYHESCLFWYRSMAAA